MASSGVAPAPTHPSISGNRTPQISPDPSRMPRKCIISVCRPKFHSRELGFLRGCRFLKSTSVRRIRMVERLLQFVALEKHDDDEGDGKRDQEIQKPEHEERGQNLDLRH